MSDTLQPPPPRPEDFVQSATITEWLTAMVVAQAMMINPRLDKEAKVSPRARDGREFQPYSYKYSSLHAITNMLRDPLTSNGFLMPMGRIVPARRGNGYELFTQIYHRSGEWMGCYWPVGVLGEKHQDVGGATSFARRYALNAILGIAPGDDDDDANHADNRAASISTVNAMNEVGASQEDAHRAIHRQILVRCREAKNPADWEQLLEVWQGAMARYGAWQFDSDKSGAFTQVAVAIRDSLKRFMPSAAEAWFDILHANNKGDASAIWRKAIKGNGEPATLTMLRENAPRIYAYIKEHLSFFGDRAAVRDPTDSSLDDAIAEVEKAFVKQPTAAPAPAPAFSFHVYDAAGDAVSDALGPLDWVECYATTWKTSERPSDVYKANDAALEALQGHDDATYRLDELMNAPDAPAAPEDPPADPGPPEQPREPREPVKLEFVIQKRSQAVDIAASLRAAEYQICQCTMLEELSAWWALNSPLALADTTPPTLKMRIQGAFMRREKELGGGERS